MEGWVAHRQTHFAYVHQKSAVKMKTPQLVPLVKQTKLWQCPSAPEIVIMESRHK